jgi:biopolymer transport protein ExbD
MVILIFLMLVGTFTAGEWVIQQNASTFVTATSSNTPPPPDFVPDEPIIIRVSQPTPDRFIAQAERITTSSADQLEQELRALRQQLLQIGKPQEKLTIVIQPRPDVKHRFYMQVYDAALRADFKKVSFAVSQ